MSRKIEEEAKGSEFENRKKKLVEMMQIHIELLTKITDQENVGNNVLENWTKELIAEAASNLEHEKIYWTAKAN
jgi:hypothetical protein